MRVILSWAVLNSPQGQSRKDQDADDQDIQDFQDKHVYALPVELARGVSFPCQVPSIISSRTRVGTGGMI